MLLLLATLAQAPPARADAPLAHGDRSHGSHHDPLAALVRRMDRYLRQKRRSLYPGGMFARGKVEGDHGDDHRTARAVTDFVRRGGRLGIVCDQHYGRGIPVPFFGRDARPQPIAAIIARRVGARLWMARCVRIGTESRFRIEIKELRVPRSANAAADIRATLAGMMRQFESWVRETPEQWMWSNRIWH